MKQTPLLALLFSLVSTPLIGNQTAITEAAGEACMGRDQSRNQTERTALTEAKRKAVEYSSTYIESTTRIENFELQQDVISAYSRADVRVLSVLDEKWESDCFTIRIRAEVIPSAPQNNSVAEDALALLKEPNAPLTIRLWSDKKEYHAGEHLKIYLTGNKDFYGRLIYSMADGSFLELLPNPQRKNNRFDGDRLHTVPADEDSFELQINPPFGTEELTLYASTAPLGPITKSVTGGYYTVQDSQDAVSTKTRGIKIVPVKSAEGTPASGVAEFSETSLTIVTSPM
ncbi:MAG: flagellar assembly protein T N-terminal domain-containing protein [Dehalococcoidia bacterium]|jgi:hypothetical protein|nr:flagellar assembly protein T N-terminal domain-containing protein [Dehalococcoidia bacterium]|tara:strand:+ start:518 stop:1375 length:858 start_codon:yes stop_codon:yes gene_type:complete